jgi:hypothetical protein
MRRNAGLACVLMAAVAAGCGSLTTPTSRPASGTPAVSSTPSEAPSPTLESVYVGGAEILAIPGASASPRIDERTAADVVMAAMASGRATMLGAHADAPSMRMTAATFVPAIVRILGPAGSHDFEPAEPIAAWVVSSEGSGSDGTYLGVGVVGQDGVLLAVYVTTPGVG